MPNDKKPPSHAKKKFVVRMPNGMRERIEALAQSNGRSMNAEIVLRVQSTLEEGGKKECESMEELVTRIFSAIGHLSEDEVKVLRRLATALKKKE